ncbi:dihydroorotate oxidase B catalytic subunit [Thermodesulfitimonas autotrophica]|uniref:Dihydroorotate dehydrogenase n=1 Tax=Thermodesulfitimonas autotrophica TaxID=1894989 RepID=A0A3N5AEK0_9THEO|nr:dihydroorotate dehydrogenase [Thermodesulfitimonas autotrophica]RPF43074.1 dihydroorotate oxidase B catalytic subunit [Thermodesulfitimonas autotrophica]
MKPELFVDLAGLRLKNPVVTASGTFGFGIEYARVVDLAALGAVVLKTVTLKPRQGNPPPRLAETPAGMLNSIGLENPGVEAVAQDILPELKRRGVKVIASVAGETIGEYATVAERLAAAGADALELNLSCPNVGRGGLHFGSDPETAAAVTRAVRQVAGNLPVFVKLGVMGADVVKVATAVAAAGASGVSLINTLPGLAVDWRRCRPILGNITGGLSGPAIKPVALWAVWRVYAATRLPIIGMGGIMSAADALEFIVCGATAVAAGTGNFVNPRLTVELVEGLNRLLAAEGVVDVKELIGAAHRRSG